MEKVIIDIIDDKATKQYNRLQPTKRKAYRAMLYAGAQVTQNGCTVREIAPEIGYSESGTSKLVQRWIGLMREGDVTVNLIISAISKLSRQKRFQHGNVNTQGVNTNNTTPAHPQKEQPTAQSLIPTPIKPKVKKVLGFIITPEDELRERAVKRASILFMQSYGKGRQARIHGEYYALRNNPNNESERCKKWLPLETAALYCGCKAEIINSAGQMGIIERRIYKHGANRNYYEYNVADLDKFIHDQLA